MAIDTDKKNDIITLRAKGRSYASIANEVGVAKQTAVDVCEQYQEEVAALNALALDELYTKEKITSEERIKAHANLLSRIREEIEKRNLSEVPTDKLIDLFIKESAALREEIVKPIFKTSSEQESDRKDRELLDSLTSFS